MKGITEPIEVLIIIMIIISIAGVAYYVYINFLKGELNQNFTIENEVGSSVVIKNIGFSPISSVTVTNTQTGQKIESYIDTQQGFPSDNVDHAYDLVWTKNSLDSWPSVDLKYFLDITCPY